jgi:hypothetical protein
MRNDKCEQRLVRKPQIFFWSGLMGWMSSGIEHQQRDETPTQRLWGTHEKLKITSTDQKFLVKGELMVMPFGKEEGAGGNRRC